MYLSDVQPASTIGLNNEFVVCPRADNLASSYASTKAVRGGGKNGTLMKQNVRLELSKLVSFYASTRVVIQYICMVLSNLKERGTF